MIDFSKLEGMVVLQQTQKLPKETATPEEAFLSETYRNAKARRDVVASYVASIVNMILTQKRIAFVITKRDTGEGIANDPNKKRGFDNNKYKLLHNVLINDLRILEVVEPGRGTRPTVYRVIHPELRSLLKVDEERQLSQAVSFANYEKKGIVETQDDSTQTTEQTKSETPVVRNSETPAPQCLAWGSEFPSEKCPSEQSSSEKATVDEICALAIDDKELPMGSDEETICLALGKLFICYEDYLRKLANETKGTTTYKKLVNEMSVVADIALCRLDSNWEEKYEAWRDSRLVPSSPQE